MHKTLLARFFKVGYLYILKGGHWTLKVRLRTPDLYCQV